MRQVELVQIPVNIFLMQINAIKLRFTSDMVVPAAGPDGMRELLFRHWTLRLSAGAADKGIAIRESFPEHDYELPTTYSYEIHSGAYLD